MQSDTARPRTTFVLAHLSDLHLGSPLSLRPHDLLSKRLIGYFSWRLRRKRIHRLQVLDQLRADLALQAPDHIAITGDVTNIALPSEFTFAARWLRALGAPDHVSVIPGNHDAYVPITWDRSWVHWQDYMRSDPAVATTAGERFPYVRRRGPIALIGLSTAVPTGPGFAQGTLGEHQIARASAVLQALRAEGLFRVVLLHHPPVASDGHGRKQLTDAPEFSAMLRQTGAELILHGHDHVPRAYELAGAEGAVPTIGAASASALPIDGHVPGQYNLYRIDAEPTGWRIEMEIRTINDALRFVESERRCIEVRRTHRQVPTELGESRCQAAPAGVDEPAEDASGRYSA